MATDLQIAEALLATCLRADHKPGKIQFTKYLYLLDYCHWRFTGRQATSLPWKFYHYGPSCDGAEACMSTLAQRFEFSWRDDEAYIVRQVEVPMPQVDIMIKSFLARIVDTFKNRDRNDLLEFAYSQTEPMVAARRGDFLDFSRVPVDKALPMFSPVEQSTAEFQLDPARKQKMDAFRARMEHLRERAKQRMTYRESAECQQALGYVAEEFGSYTGLPEMRGKISLEAVEGLGTE